MIKIFIYLIIFFIVLQVIKLFRRINQAKHTGRDRDEKLQNKFRNIEEAQYKDLGSQSNNNADKE